VTRWLVAAVVPDTVVRMGRSGARVVTLRTTEVMLERRPDLAVAVARAGLERSLTRHAVEGPRSRVVLLRLTLRAMDTHPAVARAVVRTALRRAANAR
jgi:hypothetical protein